MTERLRGALHDLADDLAMPDPQLVADTAVRGARRRHARRRLAVPMVAAVTVIAIALGAVFIVEGVGTSHPQPAAPRTGPGSLPDRIFPTPKHVYSIEEKPIARASLVYPNDQGSWIAISADEDAARRVSFGLDHPAFWGPVALSPDGTHVLLVDIHERVNPEPPITSFIDRILVVDLPTGRTSTIELASPMPFVYIDGGVSWSPDGTKLAFVLGERPTLKGSSDVTSLAVLDLASHRLDRIATLNADSSMTPAWSPDGTRLAVTDPVSELGGLLIFDLTGHVVLHVPDLWTLAPLRGSEWSPDGRTLALIDERTQKTLLFVDSASGKVEASHPFGWDFDAGINLEVFGWREGSPVVNTSRRALVSLSADGKEQQLLSSEFGMSNSIVLARDVLLDGSIRTATPPHGKPQPFHIPLSPATMQWTAVIAGITAVISLAELYDRRRYRDRRSIPRQR